MAKRWCDSAPDFFGLQQQQAAASIPVPLVLRMYVKSAASESARKKVIVMPLPGTRSLWPIQEGRFTCAPPVSDAALAGFQLMSLFWFWGVFWVQFLSCTILVLPTSDGSRMIRPILHVCRPRVSNHIFFAVCVGRYLPAWQSMIVNVTL